MEEDAEEDPKEEDAKEEDDAIEEDAAILMFMYLKNSMFATSIKSLLASHV